MAVALDVNKHLTVVGAMGRHQWLTLFLTGYVLVMFSWQVMSVIFSHNPPNFRCAENDTSPTMELDSITYDNQCEMISTANNITVTRMCMRYAYQYEGRGTVIEQFDLVCGQQYIVTVTDMAFMGSLGVGAVAGSYSSDRFGRKIVIIVVTITISVMGVIEAFSTDVIMYSVLRVVMGMFTGGLFTPIFSIVLESVSANNRPHVLNGLEFFWIAGEASLSLIFYFLRDWWKAQILMTAPGIFVGISFIWCLDESPHWLASTGKTKKALTVLAKMGRWNRVDTSALTFNPADYVTEKRQEVENSNSESLVKLWRHKRLLINVLIFSYGWIVCPLCYYVLSFRVRTLPGNIYVNNLISTFAECLGYVACFCIAWWGRKWPLVSVFFGGGLALLVSVFITTFAEGQDIALTAMSMVGKFCITAGWQIIIVWSGELYPTTRRCTLAAINTLFARIGSVLAPFMVDLEKYIDVPNEHLILPILFIVSMLIGGFLFMIPIETNKRKLPECMKDANKSSFPMMDQEAEETTEESEREAAEKFDLLENEERA